MSNMTTLDSGSSYEKSPVAVITRDEAMDQDSRAENRQTVNHVIAAAHRAASEVAISRVLIDESLQARTALDEATVADYLRVATEAAEAGHPWPFPPVQMVGGYLVDGWHRLEVAKRLGMESIPATEQPGNEHDAILAAVSANANHGLRRSREDVQRAVRLAANAWPDLSAREIARRVQCSPQTVLNLRNRDAEPDPVSKLETPPDSFLADLESLEVGQGWVQFLDDDSDSTVVARVDSGYRVYRIIGKEIIKARARDVDGVLAALDATDGEYDMLVGMEPYEFLEDAADMLEDLERAWLGIAGRVPA